MIVKPPHSETENCETLRTALVSRLACARCAIGCGEIPSVVLPRRLGSLFVCAKCWDALIKDAKKMNKK